MPERGEVALTLETVGCLDPLKDSPDAPGGKAMAKTSGSDKSASLGKDWFKLGMAGTALCCISRRGEASGSGEVVYREGESVKSSVGVMGVSS